MTAPKVRADYDQLLQMAAGFGRQAEAARRSLQQLQSQVDVLQNGDWLGKGATAFYGEMSGQVLPTLRRLAAALETAQQSTQQISQIMQAAEAEAARCLHATGAAVIMAAPGGAAVGGGIGAALGTAVGAALGGIVGAGLGGALGGAAGTAAGAAVAAAAAKLEAAQNAAVDRMLAKFDPRVRELVKQSPTLRAEMLDLEQKGWSFQTGAVADGYFTDRPAKTITIDQPQTPEVTVSHIAHEAGHAVTNQQAKIPATPAMTRDEYVRRNVDNFMNNEGEAQFNAAQVRAELNKSGGPDVGIPGSQTAAYQTVYDNFSAGKITRAQAVTQMGNLMGKETVSVINTEVGAPEPANQPAPLIVRGQIRLGGKPYAGALVRAYDKDLRSEEPLGNPTATDEEGRYEITYSDYYVLSYKKDFDDNIAPTRRR